MKKLTLKQRDEIIELIIKFGSDSFAQGLSYDKPETEKKANKSLKEVIDYINNLTKTGN